MLVVYIVLYYNFEHKLLLELNKTKVIHSLLLLICPFVLSRTEL